jgi:hypothetical protein
MSKSSKVPANSKKTANDKGGLDHGYQGTPHKADKK